MKIQVRNAAMKILLFLGLLLLGGFLDVLGLATQVRVLSSMYYLLLGVSFALHVSERIADERVRRQVVSGAWMMILFFLLRCLKYQAFREVGGIARFLWYCYYVPILVIPATCFFAASFVDSSKEKKRPLSLKLVTCVTAGLVLTVLTNDLHQGIFRFRPNFADWDSDYDHEILYFVIVAWVFALFLSALLLLAKKCRVSACKKVFWIPFLPILGGVAYVCIYYLNLFMMNGYYRFIEFPELACFVVACYWECCISIGLIPCNKGYEKLFMESKIAAQITEKDFRTVYASGAERELTMEQKESPQDVMLSEDVCLHRAQIQGGYVFWQSDLSELNRVTKELEETKERLSEETQLIRLQNEMMKKRAEIEEKNKVYDAIAAKVGPQSQRIAALAKEAEENGALFETNVKKICFYGAYVKRYANLMLLSEGREMLSAKELELALAESARALRDLGVAVALTGSNEEIPAHQALETYARLQTLLEGFGACLRGISVRITQKECKVTLEGGEEYLTKAAQGGENWPKAEQGRLENETQEWEDDVLYVRFTFEKGGAGA